MMITGNAGCLRLTGAQQLDAVKTRHAHVGDQHLRLLALEFAEHFLRRAERTAWHVLLRSVLFPAPSGSSGRRRLSRSVSLQGQQHRETTVRPGRESKSMLPSFCENEGLGQSQSESGTVIAT